MKEATLLQQIKDYLTLTGLVWWRWTGGGFRRGDRYIHVGKDLPDLGACLPNGRLVVIEVKSGDGVLTEGQAKKLARFDRSRAVVIVARDLNAVTQTIERHLTAIRQSG